MEDFIYLINFSFSLCSRPYSSAFVLKEAPRKILSAFSRPLVPATNGESRTFRKGIIPFRCLQATDCK